MSSRVGSHSVLSPSGSSRWLRCVGSVALAKGLPSLDKEYSASGTCSHWLGEWALQHPELDLDVWLGKEMTFGDNPPFSFVVDEDRIERVRQYVDNIRREPGMKLYEQKLDTTPVLGVDQQEGHADTVILYPEGGVMKNGNLLHGVISVHDYKDGYLLVNARDNTQLMIYLCAAMMHYSLVGEFEAFRGVIHQPKLNHFDEWTYSRAELVAFMELIRPVAKLVYDIWSGTVTFDPSKHLSAGEEQCGFCPVRGQCPERARYIIGLFEPIINRHQLDTVTLGQLYSKLDLIEGACKDFRAEALRRAVSGDVIHGQKLVKGRSGPRYWSDSKRATNVMEIVLGDDAFKPREPISPTQAERLLKKDAYTPLAALVSQNPGSLTLAPEDDPRPAVPSGVSVFKPTGG